MLKELIIIQWSQYVEVALCIPRHMDPAKNVTGMKNQVVRNTPTWEVGGGDSTVVEVPTAEATQCRPDIDDSAVCTPEVEAAPWLIAADLCIRDGSPFDAMWPLLLSRPLLDDRTRVELILAITSASLNTRQNQITCPKSTYHRPLRTTRHTMYCWQPQKTETFDEKYIQRPLGGAGHIPCLVHVFDKISWNTWSSSVHYVQPCMCRQCEGGKGEQSNLTWHIPFMLLIQHKYKTPWSFKCYISNVTQTPHCDYSPQQSAFVLTLTSSKQQR